MRSERERERSVGKGGRNCKLRTPTNIPLTYLSQTHSIFIGNYQIRPTTHANDTATLTDAWSAEKDRNSLTNIKILWNRGRGIRSSRWLTTRGRREGSGTVALSATLILSAERRESGGAGATLRNASGELWKVRGGYCVMYLTWCCPPVQRLRVLEVVFWCTVYDVPLYMW